MKILLIGEYSRLHNSLKEGLIMHGHDVVICGFNDGFKDFPVDFKLEKKWNDGFLKKLKVGLFKLSGFNITSWFTYKQFIKNQSRFSNFDIVQLIGENSFFCEPWIEKKILMHLFSNNKKVFLLSCGDNYPSVTYYFAHPKEKSVIQPYLMGKIKDKDFPGVLKYRQKKFRELHEYIFARIAGVIASDLDYHFPLVGNPKYLGMIPNPVNVDKIAFSPLKIIDKVRIFVGINTESFYKKGMDYFVEAVQIVNKKYMGQVDVIISHSRPYAEYITLYDGSHILLDQAFARDQGYNALEAMAKGKVVFTGAESEFFTHYNLNLPVAINAVPDVNSIVQSLSQLIENPHEIIETGKRARGFVEKEHHYVAIASKYLEVWASV